MHILCPHCQSPIELVKLTPREEIVCPSCGSSFKLESESTTGWTPSDGQRKLGKFELIDTVGHGAFGTVYIARDPELDRVVAIKVPRSGNLADGQELDCFLREARSVAQLRHPSIVPVHEVGQQEGVPYLVSDFVRGTKLADLLTARRPTPHEAAQLIAAVADALQYAHEQGVVHRDVKPSNIMLTPPSEGGDLGGWQPHLMDFGLAKRDAGEITMTIDGQVLGTPAYMSPEQARGEGHQVDGRSDVYSLGVILYQLLTGELPFRGNTRMLLHQVLHDEPRPPRSLNDKIPRDLETVCLKAMAKEARRRYSSARELADDLRRFLKGEPIQARPVSRRERLGRWCRRNPALAALLGVSGLLAVVLIVGLVVINLLSVQLLDQRTRSLQDLQAEQKETEKALAQERQASYFQRVALAYSSWRANNVLRAEQLLDDCPPELRQWEWDYLKRLCQAGQLTLRGHTDKVFGVAFSPNGKWLASASQDQTVRIWDAHTGRLLHTLREHKQPVNRVAFSPDSRLLASADGDDEETRPAAGTVMLWDPETGQPVRTFKGHSSPVSSLAFSPDGKSLLSASGWHSQPAAGKVIVWDVTSGKETLNLAPRLFVVYSAVFHPDGRQLALGGSRFDLTRGWCGEVRLVEAATGTPGHTLAGSMGMMILQLAFSPDGQWLVAASYDKTLKFWDITKRDNPISVRGHSGLVAGVAFAPKGKQVARTANGWPRAAPIKPSKSGT